MIIHDFYMIINDYPILFKIIHDNYMIIHYYPGLFKIIQEGQRLWSVRPRYPKLNWPNIVG